MRGMPGERPIWVRRTLLLRGTLQGVGFRPAVSRLATRLGLGGSVRNLSGSVEVILEGPREAVDAFEGALPLSLPPQARLLRLERAHEETLPHNAPPSAFVVAGSEAAGPRRAVLPVDLAICDACRRELFDPADRRHGYAFTTCTDCGPRHTVVTGLPYDRERTTLRAFPLCARCRAEYENPADRRCHAESIACPECGPQLRFADAGGRALNGDPLRRARAALAAGAVVAVRGLGGFHLAADAFRADTIDRLRDRKRRPHKPLAVMARDLDTIRRQVEVPDAAAELLASPAAPIVILDVRPDAAPALPVDRLAPDTHTLGVMRPTTPLHELLFRPLDGDPTPAFDWLVMTSGNRRGEPMCRTNEEALARLAGIADFFLLHDREIHLRNDDSVCVIRRGRPQVWRRARGFAPDPLRLAAPLRRRVLAMGAEIKNAIAVGAGDEVVVSPHVGDLETPEAVDALAQLARELPAFLESEPEVIAVDAHPDMHATRIGRERAAREGIPVVVVQHHHAHAAAVLAEHGIDEALAVVFDGTGWGADGRIWGAELLRVSTGACERLGTFGPAPLPGGDAAVRRPARQLVARWIAAGREIPGPWLVRLGVTRAEVDAWRAQIEHGVNAPLSHGAGRVFDAFAAALGVAPGPITYEGQPAIRLEALARRAPGGGEADVVSFAVAERDGLFRIDWAPAFERLLERPPADADAPRFARAFHDAMARAAMAMAGHGRERTGLDRIALTGGVFMNRLLTEAVVQGLEHSGFAVYTAESLPPNDGAIALGQAVVAGRCDGARPS